MPVGEAPEPTLPPVTPIEYFTSGPAYHETVLPDRLRLRAVSPRFNKVVQEINTLVGVKFARLTVPTLVVLATRDRLTDNATTERAFARLRAQPKQLVRITAEHAIQFDAPAESARHIHDWITSFH